MATPPIDTRPWHRETAMRVVIGVLAATFIAGAVILYLAASGEDSLVISDAEYRELRDDLRATSARPVDDDD